jgi:hypothetical protein
MGEAQRDLRLNKEWQMLKVVEVGNWYLGRRCAKKECLARSPGVWLERVDSSWDALVGERGKKGRGGTGELGSPVLLGVEGRDVGGLVGSG